MTTHNEDYYERQYKFERNFIRIPFVVFAVIVLLFNIFSQILISCSYYLVFSSYIMVEFYLLRLLNISNEQRY